MAVVLKKVKKAQPPVWKRTAARMEMVRARPSLPLMAQHKGGGGTRGYWQRGDLGDGRRWQLSGVWKSRSSKRVQLCPNSVPSEVKGHFISPTER